MFERLRKWLSGEIICSKCGNVYHIMTFGYGIGICPTCYQYYYSGEKDFIVFDEDYFLNRLLIRCKMKMEVGGKQ